MADKKKEQQTDTELETTTTVIGDWRIVHQTAPDGTVRKFMNQRGVDGNNNKQVFQIGFQYQADTKETIVELFLPLGVVLPAGVKFGFSEKNEYEAMYQSCFQEGCLAVARVDKTVEKKFKEDGKGFIEFTHSQGGHMKLPFSLKGFSQGFKKLKEA
ncbi:MAG: invasion associated locus B family protein [Emcibacteraceae bacterium]|nr:invasion associated locus B family protein [Emcibacteraceae bacterium]MDG1858257.1 invasion associated locus B family protein [Emcibacteraceae bacterium]